MSNFADVFRALRLKSGLTQQELADRLKVSRSSIGMYESGERSPDFELLERIADFFHVDMNYLFGKKEVSEHIPDSSCLNQEALQIAQFFLENPDYRPLLEAVCRVKKEDMGITRALLDRFAAADPRNPPPYRNLPR